MPLIRDVKTSHIFAVINNEGTLVGLYSRLNYAELAKTLDESYNVVQYPVDMFVTDLSRGYKMFHVEISEDGEPLVSEEINGFDHNCVNSYTIIRGAAGRSLMLANVLARDASHAAKIGRVNAERLIASEKFSQGECGAIIVKNIR